MDIIKRQLSSRTSPSGLSMSRTFDRRDKTLEVTPTPQAHSQMAFGMPMQVRHSLQSPPIHAVVCKRPVQTPRHHALSPRRHVTMLANRPFVSRVAGGALKLLIKSLCTTADNLHVDIDASSNLAFLSGHLKAVSVTASRIIYNGFAVSGGAALYTDEISLTTRYPGTSITSAPRLVKPFSVSIHATLTENDLNRPGPVRDALQALLRQIIATGLGGAVGRHLPTEIGGVTCVLDRVKLADPLQPKSTGFFGFMLRRPQDAGGKIILKAHAELSDGKKFYFAVRTGLTTVADGNIVKLSDPELLWRKLTIPMVTIDMIGIKLDATTKLTNVEIEHGMLSGDGIMVISPPIDVSRRLGRWEEQTKAPRRSRRGDRVERRRLPPSSRDLG